MVRILIRGGGFGGVNAALTLEKLPKAELDRGEVELGPGLLRRDRAPGRPLATHHAEGEELTDDRPVAPAPLG